MTHKFEYIVEDHGDVYPDDAVEFENLYTDREVDWLVADAAGEDYDSNADPSDDGWPLVFAIYRDGELHGRFSVKRDYLPEYISVTLPTFPRMPPAIAKQWRRYFATVGIMAGIRKANPNMSAEFDKVLTETYRDAAKKLLHRLVFP